MSTLIDDLLELAQTAAPTFDEGPRTQWLSERLSDAVRVTC